METGAWTDDELRRIATLYYFGEQKMEAIAASRGSSRSTVSRQLKVARERGIVRIDIPTGDTGGGTAALLAKTFGVEAHVVPVRESATESQRLSQVARFAGHLLSGWFDDDVVMGLAWGTTTSAVMDNLVPKPTRGATVVQLNGAVNAVSAEVGYVSNLLGRVRDAFDAKPVHFPVPAFFDDPVTKAALWRERSIAGIVDLQRRSDFVVFGVGSWEGPITSQVHAGGYLTADDVTDLKRSGVVGDVCTTFFRADGSWADLRINDRSSGPGMAELSRIPRRMCVVAGAGRVRGTIGALRAGAISHLVVDERTAGHLIEAVSAGPRRRRQR